MKHLYLMRHGETLFNVRRKIQRRCDSPLTEHGINQAKAARKYLKGIHFDHYYSSTFKRCCDTLEIVTNDEVEYKRLKQLKERNFGSFEGESEDLNLQKNSGLDRMYTTLKETRRLSNGCILHFTYENEHFNFMNIIRPQVVEE